MLPLSPVSPQDNFNVECLKQHLRRGTFSNSICITFTFLRIVSEAHLTFDRTRQVIAVQENSRRESTKFWRWRAFKRRAHWVLCLTQVQEEQWVTKGRGFDNKGACLIWQLPTVKLTLVTNAAASAGVILIKYDGTGFIMYFYVCNFTQSVWSKVTRIHSFSSVPLCVSPSRKITTADLKKV